MQIAYVFVSEGRAVAVHQSKEKAMAQADARAEHRIKHEGATLHARHSFEPKAVKPGTKVRVGGSEGSPILAEAPVCVNCQIYSVVILIDGKYAEYSVSQFPVVS